MNNEEIKYYVSSDGTQTPISNVDFVHLANGLAKRYREMFNSLNKIEFGSKLQEINDIKDEMHKRLNEFYEKLEEE